MEERIQKILSRAGVASRRKAEEMIRDGRVTVNGQIVTELGSKADLDRDHIKADGKLVHRPKQLVYLMLNKPSGYVTTMFDPEGRRKVTDLIHGIKERVYPVGRLDYASEGLLLLTNDGDFANLIMSASSEIAKRYTVKVSGQPKESDLDKLRQGVRLNGRLTAPAQIRLLRDAPNPWYEVVIVEGRQNQIRRMFQKVGHMVEKLKRVQIGPLELGDMPVGKFRNLTPPEVERFRRLGPRKAGIAKAAAQPRPEDRGRARRA